MVWKCTAEQGYGLTFWMHGLLRTERYRDLAGAVSAHFVGHDPSALRMVSFVRKVQLSTPRTRNNCPSVIDTQRRRAVERLNYPRSPRDARMRRNGRRPEYRMRARRPRHALNIPFGVRRPPAPRLRPHANGCIVPPRHRWSSNLRHGAHVVYTFIASTARFDTSVEFRFPRKARRF